MRSKLIAITALAAFAAVPAIAQAHVTITPESAPADGFARLEFAVGHGCEGSPTTSIAVGIPESVPSATPQRHPMWELSTREGPKDETELHGETITRGVSEVTWTAREPLPDDELDVFGMSVRLPAAAGETLEFPVIQRCEEGVHRWIESVEPGEEEPEEPAPTVTLTAAEGEHGAAAKDEAEGEDAEGASEEAEADDDGGSDGLAIAGLIAGALGLLTGGTALVRSRRNG